MENTPLLGKLELKLDSSIWGLIIHECHACLAFLAHTVHATSFPLFLDFPVKTWEFYLGLDLIPHWMQRMLENMHETI